MSAFAFLASKRLSRERHLKLSDALLAQSGDQKVLKKQFDDWERDF